MYTKPKAEDLIPERVRTLLTEDIGEIELDKILEWVIYGDVDAEQVEDDTPEDRRRLAKWFLLDVEPRWHLNVYIVHEEYGGPEEGGWWFRRHVPLQWSPGSPVTMQSSDFKVLEGQRLMMEELGHKIAERDNIHQAMIEATIEYHPPRVSPKHRPHYC